MIVYVSSPENMSSVLGDSLVDCPNFFRIFEVLEAGVADSKSECFAVACEKGDGAGLRV